MRDYICVDVRGQVETDANAARVSGGVGVGDQGQSGGVGEAEGDWCGRVVEMGCGGEFFGFGGGREGTVKHQAAGVSCRHTRQSE